MNISTPADSRLRILETARMLFAQQGYSCVTVRTITTAAGVSQAMISYYFGGKEALYGEVISCESSFILSLFDQEDLSHLPPRKRLKAFADTINLLHRDRPWIASLIHQEMISPTRFLGESVIPALEIMTSFLRETIREGIDRGDFRADLDCSLSVYALVAIVSSRNVLRPLVSRIIPVENQEDSTDRLLDIFFQGVDPRDR